MLANSHPVEVTETEKSKQATRCISAALSLTYTLTSPSSQKAEFLIQNALSSGNTQVHFDGMKHNAKYAFFFFLDISALSLKKIFRFFESPLMNITVVINVTVRYIIKRWCLSVSKTTAVSKSTDISQLETNRC